MLEDIGRSKVYKSEGNVRNWSITGERELEKQKRMRQGKTETRKKGRVYDS